MIPNQTKMAAPSEPSDTKAATGCDQTPRRSNLARLHQTLQGARPEDGVRIKQEFLSEENPYNDVIDLAAASAAASPISRDGSTGTPNTDELYGSDEENDMFVTENVDQDMVET